MKTPLRTIAASLLLVASTAPALAEMSAQQREFADSMILCNSHALLLHMYTQGKDGKPLPGIPKPVDYRELAYQTAGKEYVGQWLESSTVRDKAVEQLGTLLNAKPYEGLSEKERDDHMSATWSKIITTCNDYAAAGPAKAKESKSKDKAKGK